MHPLKKLTLSKTLHKKVFHWGFLQFPADLVTFAEEIPNGKLYFLRRKIWWNLKLTGKEEQNLRSFNSDVPRNWPEFYFTQFYFSDQVRYKFGNFLVIVNTWHLVWVRFKSIKPGFHVSMSPKVWMFRVKSVLRSFLERFTP